MTISYALDLLLYLAAFAAVFLCGCQHARSNAPVQPRRLPITRATMLLDGRRWP